MFSGVDGIAEFIGGPNGEIVVGFSGVICIFKQGDVTGRLVNCKKVRVMTNQRIFEIG